MKEADEFIESKRQEKEEWQALLNDMKAGKEIDPERLKALNNSCYAVKVGRSVKSIIY